jgi:hypothetical protein
VPCPGGCSDRGVCAFGKCFCVPGAGGEDCSQSSGGGEWTFSALAFDVAWKNAGDSPVGVWASLDGQCVLTGSVGGGTTAAPVGVLPSSCRPNARVVFGARTHSGAAARVDILPNGSVIYVAKESGAASAPIALDGLHFTTGKLEPLGAQSGVGAPLEGSRPFGVAVGADTCTLGGTAAVEGAQTQWTDGLLGELPEACKPVYRLSFAVSSSQGATRVDVLPDGRVYRAAGGPGWISLDGIRFPASKASSAPLALGAGWSEATENDPPETLEFAGPSYRRTGGLCMLSGLARRLDQNATVITTLPKTCRPAGGGRLVFGDAWSPGGVVIVDSISGAIERAASADADWISLDGISFPGQ